MSTIRKSRDYKEDMAHALDEAAAPQLIKRLEKTEREEAVDERREQAENKKPKSFVDYDIASGERFSAGDKTMVQGWADFHALASRLFPVDWSQGYPRPLVEMRDARGQALAVAPKLANDVLTLQTPEPDHGQHFLPYPLDGSKLPRADGADHINKTKRRHSQATYKNSTTASLAHNRYVAKKKTELGEDVYRQIIREYKQRSRKNTNGAADKAKLDKSYHRPFVAIDAEGMDFPDDDRTHNGAVYPKHKTFLWGAKGWKRDVERALTPEEIKLKFGPRGDVFGETWLPSTGSGQAQEKRPLRSREILDWLLTLPETFGDVNFVMYSFGYDMTQILAGLPYETAYEIVKQESYKKDANGRRRKFRGDVFYGPYGISYLKGKYFKLGRLRDPASPFVIGDDGKKKIDYATSITIYDAFGFYGKSFAEVVKSLIGQGYATPEDYELIKATKGERHEFASVDFERVKHYCGLELLYLSKALTVLRDGFDAMNIRLKAWSGAGSAAGALRAPNKTVSRP